MAISWKLLANPIAGVTVIFVVVTGQLLALQASSNADHVIMTSATIASKRTRL